MTQNCSKHWSILLSLSTSSANKYVTNVICDANIPVSHMIYQNKKSAITLLSFGIKVNRRLFT